MKNPFISLFQKVSLIGAFALVIGIAQFSLINLAHADDASTTTPVVASDDTSTTPPAPAITSNVVPTTAILQVSNSNVPGAGADISINGAAPYFTTSGYSNPAILNAGYTYTVTGPTLPGYTLGAYGDCNLGAPGAVPGTTYTCNLYYTAVVVATTTPPSTGLGTGFGGDTSSSTASSSDVSGTFGGSGSTDVNQDTGGTFGGSPSTDLNQDNSGADTTPPTISSMPDISTTTTSTGLNVDFPLPTAMDAVDGSITPVCVPSSGSFFSIGTTPVICTATDVAGNAASTTFNVIVTATSTPSNPSNPTTPTVPQVIFSGGGGGGGGGEALGGTTSTTTITGTLSCPFLTGYVVPGRIANILGGTSVNNVAQIEKLQVFLNTYEGDSAVAVTGVIDQQTIAGIIAFQQKYLGAIMGPWGANSPSGNVYITTMREINAIVCGPQPSLTPAEQAVINKYLATVAANNAGANNGGTNTGANNSGAENNNSNGGTNTGSATVTSTSTASTTINGGSNASTTGTTGSTTPDNTALTGNVVSSGAGNFLSSFFGKIFSFFGIK